MTTVLNGALGGLAVGVVAAVVARFLGGSPSGEGVGVLEQFAGEVAGSRWAQLGVGAGYGGLAGGVLVALELAVLGLLAVPPSPAEALGVAVVWSAILLAVSTVAVRVSRGADRSAYVRLVGYHVVYGVGVGLWIRLTWIT